MRGALRDQRAGLRDEHTVTERPVDDDVRDALRLGAHQVLRMRVPDHAAVASTVDRVLDVVGPRPTLKRSRYATTTSRTKQKPPTTRNFASSDTSGRTRATMGWDTASAYRERPCESGGRELDRPRRSRQRA